MSAHTSIALEARPSIGEDTLSIVFESLRLESWVDPERPSVRILRRRSGARIAAVTSQSPTFRGDRAAIETLKTLDPSLPIIFVAASFKPRREAAIRRLGIHYFLAYPIEHEELRLVLDALIHAASPAASYERFFTR